MTTGDGSIRVVIAEDSVLLRQGISKVVRDAGYEVVGEVGDGDELVRIVNLERPHLVITDIRMPPSHSDEGLRAAIAIRAAHPDIALVVLSQYVEPRYADELLQDGSTAIGYLLKDRVTHVREFQEALRRVVAGGTVIDPEVVSVLIDRPRKSDPLGVLSPREREVLKLMAEGHSNQGISEALFLSPRTVESHIKSIFIKLDFLEEPNQHRRVLAVVTYLRSLNAPANTSPRPPR